MRKIWSILVIALTALIASINLTSCDYDEDDSISYNLDGTWEGALSAEYFVYRHGEEILTEGYEYVSFHFDQKGYTAHGKGYETNYNIDGRIVREFDFNYQIEDEVIYLIYNNGEVVRISNYTLVDDKFYGVITDPITGEQISSFTLTKVVE